MLEMPPIKEVKQEGEGKEVGGESENLKAQARACGVYSVH